MMRFYDRQHRFTAGIDLHGRAMHLCILDATGAVVFDKNIPCSPDAFLAAIARFRKDLIVGAECMFGWYWLDNLCRKEKISFLIGHALYMKAIHGGKAKNDRIDAHKIARLLRGGNFPLAYVYPHGMRETRDLLRRRSFFVRLRSGLFTHLQILNIQYNLPPFGKKLGVPGHREEMNIAKRFPDVSVQQNALADLNLIDRLDEQIAAMERHLTRTAKVDDTQTYHRLQTIPGVGIVLALVLLYEIHDIKRFASAGQFLSYCRLVRCEHESNNKVLGHGGKKIGNAQLRWAFGEAACLFLRSSERAKAWKQKQAKKRGEGKALAILAAKLARAVYHMWRKGEAFDETRFWQGKQPAAKD
jgi:transposase